MTDSSQPRHRRWRVGDLIVDEPSLQILKNDRVITAESAQVSTLIALIEAWPEIIDKNRLIDRVWGQRVVSDAAVHKTISLLRRQLKIAGAGDCIETRHRLGYRLIDAPVLVDQGLASGSPDPIVRARPGGRRWLPGMLTVVLAVGVVGALLFLRDQDSVLPRTDAIDAPASTDRIDEALGERETEALIALARTSLPGDLGLAERALVELESRTSRGEVDAPSRALVEKYFGILHFYRSEHQRAIERWQRALTAFETLGDRNETANVLTNLGAAHEERDAPVSTVASFYDRALELRRELGEPEGLARTLNNLATLWIGRGQVEPARAAVEELRQVADAMGQPAWQIRASILAGDLEALLPAGDAAPAFDQAHEQAVLAGRAQDAAVAAQRLARTFGERADWEMQREWLERARRHLGSAGLVARVPVIDYALGLNHERRGQPEAARVAYRSVIEQLPEGESIHLSVDAEVGLARLEFQSGDVASARARIDAALRRARIHDHALAEVSALLAGGFIDLSEPDGLVSAFRAVADIRERLAGEVPFGIQRHLLRLEALALIGSQREAEALDVLARLGEEARQRGHRTAARDSQLIESIALFSAGRFNEGWRAHQLALGQSLIPMSSDEDASVPAMTPGTARPDDRAGDWRWMALLTLPAFGLGWLLSSIRRNGRKRSGP